MKKQRVGARIQVLCWARACKIGRQFDQGEDSKLLDITTRIRVNQLEKAFHKHFEL
jgi:hypothetical protein